MDEFGSSDLSQPEQLQKCNRPIEKAKVSIVTTAIGW